MSYPYPKHELDLDMIKRLTKERNSIKHHMDLCRSLLKTPADDVLSESIAAIIKERNELAAKLATAEAKCAEMRDLLTGINLCNEDCLRICPGCHVEIEDGDENDIEAEHSLNCRFIHALSDQCGKGIVTKPCYCLGVNTIRIVAAEGQLETEQVAFVAASDLFHKDPYADQCGKGILDKMVEMEATHTEIVANQLFLRAQAENRVEKLEKALGTIADESAAPWIVKIAKQALEETKL